MRQPALTDFLGALIPVAVFLNLAAYRLKTTARPVTVAQWAVIAGVDVLLVGGLLWGFRTILRQRNRRSTAWVPRPANRFARESVAVWVVVLAHLAAKAPYLDLVPRWDSGTYFGWVAYVTGTFRLSLLSLAEQFRLADHPSQAYGLYLAIGQMLLRYSHVVANVQNAGLAALGVFAFWLLLRRLGADWSPPMRVLCTVLFAFNPLFFGVSLTTNADLPVTVFLIVVLTCFVYARLVGFAFAGLCLCFSKEPGVLAFGLLLVLLVALYAVPRAKSLTHLIFDFDELVSFKGEPLVGLQRGPKAIFSSVAVVALAVFPLTVFLFYHHALPKATWTSGATTWNDAGYLCFGLNTRMFRTVLGEALLLNFNWIPTLVVFAYLARSQIWPQTGRDASPTDAGRVMHIVAYLFVAYLLVHCLYINYLNPRYVLALVPLWILLAGESLHRLVRSDRVRVAGCATYCLLSLAQTWYALDPVSNSYWGTFQIGNRTMLHVGGDIPADTQGKADGLVYNAQFAAVERLYRGVNHYYLGQVPQPVLLFGSSHYWMVHYCLDPVRFDPSTLDYTTKPEYPRIGLIAIDELTPEHQFPRAVYVAMPWLENPDASLRKVQEFYTIRSTHRVYYGSYYLDTYDLARR